MFFGFRYLRGEGCSRRKLTCGDVLAGHDYMKRMGICWHFTHMGQVEFISGG